jgi:hypothetical protein
MSECLVDLENGLCSSSDLLKVEQLFLVETAVFIVLMPQILKLQLLVEDRELEKQLRKQALMYLERTCGRDQSQ